MAIREKKNPARAGPGRTHPCLTWETSTRRPDHSVSKTPSIPVSKSTRKGEGSGSTRALSSCRALPFGRANVCASAADGLPNWDPTTLLRSSATPGTTAKFTDDQEDKPVVKSARRGLNWMQWTGPRRRPMEAHYAFNKLDPTSNCCVQMAVSRGGGRRLAGDTGAAQGQDA
jgi:hypothetical protein